MLHNKPILPDPWESPNPPQKPEPAPQPWKLFKEPCPSSAAAGSPDAPRLPTHQLSSTEILLEEELKLKALSDRILKPQLEKALALIYWLETIANSNQMESISPS